MDSASLRSCGESTPSLCESWLCETPRQRTEMRWREHQSEHVLGWGEIGYWRWLWLTWTRREKVRIHLNSSALGVKKWSAPTSSISLDMAATSDALALLCKGLRKKNVKQSQDLKQRHILANGQCWVSRVNIRWRMHIILPYTFCLIPRYFKSFFKWNEQDQY